MSQRGFAGPGFGRLLVASIRRRGIRVVAAIRVGLNLPADFGYTCLDPRVVHR